MELIAQWTRGQLAALNACPEGLALFDKLAPTGTLTLRNEVIFADMMRLVLAASPEWLTWLGLGHGDGNGYGSEEP